MTSTPSPTRGVSAVVVTYNSAHCIEECLRSLVTVVAPDELIVVDNASVDESLVAVRRAAPDAVVIESSANIGFGRACNLGVARARGDHVLFVNPDVVVTRADLAALRAALSVSVLGQLVPLLSSAQGAAAEHQIFPYRGWRRIVRERTLSLLRPREARHIARPARSAKNAWAAAALLVVSRREFLDLGGFDDRYFLYAEDVDLSRRYRERGLSLRLTGAIVGHHVGAASSDVGEGLRVAPLAWSILGSLEYLTIWDGERVGRRAASAALRTLRAELWLLQGLGSVPGLRRRARRKSQQVEEILAFLSSRAFEPDDPGLPPFCPGATAALSAALAPDSCRSRIREVPAGPREGA
jgi:N-acetylglucosaminyl-diphospho-decaprenol L-rhamnosyltransferase